MDKNTYNKHYIHIDGYTNNPNRTLESFNGNEYQYWVYCMYHDSTVTWAEEWNNRFNKRWCNQRKQERLERESNIRNNIK